MSTRARGIGLRTIVLFAVGIMAAAVLTAMPIATPKAEAASFDAGHIIDDEVFYDSTTMTESQIRSFINSKVPKCRSGYTCLDAYKENTTARSANKYCKAISSGKNEDAARIIYKVSRACDINPQVILVTLQKEQGLLTHEWPSEWRYTIAMGFGCPDGADCNSKYFGFQNQLYLGARQFQIYRLYPNDFGYRAGRTNTIKWHPNSSCGTSQVYIENQATAGLYNYTPYRPNSAALKAGYGVGDSCSSYGNRNFFLYFTDWFGSTYSGYSANPHLAALQKKYFSQLGETTSGLVNYADGGQGQEFEKGWAYWGKKTGAHFTRGHVGLSFITLKGPMGVLGYPTTNFKSEPSGGSSQQFQKGALYYSPAHSIHRLSGHILTSYKALGGPSGKLGFPLDAQKELASGKYTQPFESGSLYYSSSLGIHYVEKAFNDEYNKAGGVKSALGFPVDSTRANSDGSKRQEFQNGWILRSASGTMTVSDRVYGSDRYSTAVKASQLHSKTGGKVYIATGSDFPDALSAAAKAGAEDAPLLLVSSTSIPSVVATELKRLKPSSIVIVGGKGAVSSSVESGLKKYASVTRVSGADRYATSQSIVKSYGSSSTVFIATGRDFPDALSAGAAAGANGAPVLLVDGSRSTVDGVTASTLTSVGAKNIVIVGGTGVVSSGISKQLSSSGYAVTRLGASDRYGTAAAVNAKYFPKAKTTLVATGTGFADALTGSALAGRTGAAMYIAPQKCLPKAVSSQMSKQGATLVHLFGGPTVLNKNIGRYASC